MIKKISKFVLALGLGALFLWLALRHVHLARVWKYARNNITFWWVPPFCITVFLSNMIRANRWGLLIEHDKKDLNSITLIAGVLTGYLLNFVGPRFGDASRPVYVAKKEGLPPSKLIGTIVLERAIDLATLIVLMIFVGVYIISDVGLLRQIFGDETIDIITGGVPFITVLWIIFGGILIALIGYFVVKGIEILSGRFEKLHGWVKKGREYYHQFKEGLLAVRQVERWGLFLLYTVLLWTCYTLMTYIPFYMFDMQKSFHLGLIAALAITVVAAIGIAIPVPGGIGTYHFFVKQTLLVVFMVPGVTGFAYATVTHAATLLTVIFLTPIVLAVDKWKQTRQGRVPA